MLYRNKTCIVCRERGTWEDFGSTCPSCRREAEEEKKREHLEALKKLSVEERLARIEEQLYDRPWSKMGWRPEPRLGGQ